MNRLEKKLSGWAANKWTQHLSFWTLSFYVLLRLFAYELPPSGSDWIYTLLFHLPLLVAVYINLNWLIPRYLRRQRYLLYTLLTIGLLVSATYFNLFTFEYLADLLFPGYYFIAYYEFGDIVQFVFAYMLLSALFKLSKGWFQLNVQEKRLARLEREKSDAELRALKSQLDPHFLFNSLNNLYSLALDQDERTPEILLKLSESIRYMLYECSEHYVALDRELEYVRHYLELQQIRHDPLADLRWAIRGSPTGKKIAPLLFLPLIENAFKHGLKGNRQAGFIHLTLTIEEAAASLRIANSVGSADPCLPRSGGIGLANLRRRLGLLYPEKHQLHTERQEDQFIATLKLQLS